MKKKITIVIPIYCEARNINFLFKELNSETKKLTNYLWTFIFVNDGSHDDSIIILKKLSNKYKFVKIIEFSKNFGKEIALTAGVHHAQNSDAVICIDADLQHPPSLIPQLIKKWENGVFVEGQCIHCNKCMPSIYQGTHCFLVPHEERPGHGKWPPPVAKKVGIND